MDDRERFIASLQGAAAMHNPSYVSVIRKNNPTRKELERERDEEKTRKREADQDDKIFKTQLKTNWTYRTLQLRQNINSLSSRQRDAERAAEQAKTTLTPQPAAPTATPQ